jgi:phosphatidylserine decarboxylase
MALSLDEWLKTEASDLEEIPMEKMGHRTFFRDPHRFCSIDRNFFFSPADGVLVYQKFVPSSGEIIEIKGQSFTLQELMQDDEFDQPALVIGIFMTFYDVHINRSPFGGYLRFQELDPIKTYGFSMSLAEEEIMDGVVSHEHFDYLRSNQRVLNEFYLPSWNYRYYLIQIADLDIRVIMPFVLDQNNWFHQNQRFSMVRWGSQVDLVLPLDKRFEFQLVWKDTMHVQAGLDKLVRVKKNQSIILPSE